MQLLNYTYNLPWKPKHYIYMQALINFRKVLKRGRKLNAENFRGWGIYLCAASGDYWVERS